MKVIAGHPDHPLLIGDVEIPCFVLENEARVITRRGVYTAISGERAESGAQILRFVGRKWIKPFIPRHLGLVLKSPIFFSWKTKRMSGYPASLLPDLCSAIVDAKLAGKATSRQDAIVERSRILVKAFAKMGIIALVDEATGYQKLRDDQALQRILDQFLTPDHAKWSKRFPDEFYREMFRLKRWEWRGMKVNRPQIVAQYTNGIVWSRLAPGILEELEKINPMDASGRRDHRFHQHLTDDVGHPALQAHLLGVIVLMRASIFWIQFRLLLNRAYPKHRETKVLPYDL